MTGSEVYKQISKQDLVRRSVRKMATGRTPHYWILKRPLESNYRHAEDSARN